MCNDSNLLNINEVTWTASYLQYYKIFFSVILYSGPIVYCFFLMSLSEFLDALMSYLLD